MTAIGRTRPGLAAALALALALALAVPPARAAFPGANGRIAYNIPGTLGIATIDPDGSNPTPLTSAREVSPAWSPDGTKIAFSWLNPAAGNRDIYVMNADGTGVTQLTTDPLSDVNPSWSPDGTKLVFTSNRADDGNGNHLNEIWTMNADGSNQTQLTHSVRADFGDWSPDGSRIAYIGNDGNTPAVRVVNADGTNDTAVVASSFIGTGISWAPDGSRIAYSKDAPQTSIYTIRPDGTGDFQLTRLPPMAGFLTGGDTDPSWSPDGTRIAFSRDLLSGGSSYVPANVWTINPDGTGETQVTTSTIGGLLRLQPDWGVAPDTAAPVTTISLSPTSPTGSNGWYRGPVTATVAASDTGSGVAATRCALDPLTAPSAFGDLADACALTGAGQSVSADGTHTIYAASRDHAGNIELLRQSAFKIDATAPALAFAGATTYTVDQTVAVTCTAGDGGSGLAAPNPCASPLASGPAYTYPLGSNAIGPLTAKDLAGNTTTKTTSFTVKVTPTTLCVLTKGFVQGSAKYQALKPALRAAVDALATAACNQLDGIVAGLSPAKKAALVSLYKTAVGALVTPGWLTAAQATTLKNLAAAL
jgi:Tol biopolymer transport system component